MTKKDFFHKALSKLSLAGEDRLPAGTEAPAGPGNGEKDRQPDPEILNRELKSKELLVVELQRALDKQQTERERAEIELAGKASELRSAVNNEREDYRLRCDRLEKEFSAMEKALMGELQGLKETVSRKDADLDRLNLDLRTAREKRKTDKDEVDALKDKIRGLDTALQQTRFSLEEKDKYITTAVKALERVKKEAEGNFEKLSSREKDVNKLKTSFESATAGVDNLKADLAAREREITTMEKARLKEPNALKDALARLELDNIRLKKDLAESLEKTALHKAEAEARKLELQDVSVFNKSAISALREKDEEINALEDRLKAAQKDLETAVVKQGDLESLRDNGAKLAAELQRLEHARERDISELQQARARDIGALEHARNHDVSELERELNRKDLSISELQNKIELLNAERERGERLVAKAEELRAAIGRERVENAAERDQAEREASAREKALMAEIQVHKEAAAHKDAVAESLRVELAGVRASHSASRKELNSALARIIELENLKDDATRTAAETAKLRELHAKELTVLQSELGDKERVISSFNSESARAREEYKRLELELDKKSAEFNAAANKAGEEHRAHCDKLEKEFSSREKALVAELLALKEGAGHKEAVLVKLGLELKSARELHEAAKKQLDSGAAELSKLENLKAAAARLAGEIKKLEEARSRDSRAFALELGTRDQIIAAVNGELSALQVEHARVKRELAGKTLEMKSALAKESKDQQAVQDRQEKEFAAREKALNAELQALKEASSRREAEFDKVRTDLETVRGKRESEKKIVESYAAISGELEKTRADAERKGSELGRLNMDLKNLRERHDEDSKRMQFYSAMIQDLEKFREEAADKTSALAKLTSEANALREIHEAERKELETYPARLAELERYKGEAARLAFELNSLREIREAERKEWETYPAKLGELEKHKGEAARLAFELNSLREIREADRKALETYPARLAELERYKGEAARLALEINNLRENGAQDVKALEQDLKKKTQAAASLQSEFARRQEESERAERELAEQSSGLKTQLNGEREEYRARLSRLEDDFAAKEKTLRAEQQSAKVLSADREKTLAAELQAARELTGRKEAEAGKLSVELKNIQDKYAEALREDFTANYDMLEKDFAAREKTLVAALRNLEETAGRQEAELDALNLELKAIREKYEAAAQEIESADGKILELEKLKDSAERSAGEMNKLKESHARETASLRQELNRREQAVAALNAESAKREEERRRAEAELAGKGAEFKTQLNKEREEYRARCDQMAKEFSSREKALITELQDIKDTASRRAAELDRLVHELKRSEEALNRKAADINKLSRELKSALEKRGGEPHRKTNPEHGQE